MKALLWLVLAGSSVLVALPALSQLAPDLLAQQGGGQGAKPAPAGAMSDGEVRKIDKSAGKVTIKHGPLQDLNMPPMTMVFRVKDPAILDQLKEGDKIKFSADRINGAIVVTEVQVVP
jgi:Cu/Ag efflux protein CusF